MSDAASKSTAPTRSAVLFVHAESYRRRAGVDHEKWVEYLDWAYCTMVPEAHRSLNAPDLAAHQNDAEKWVSLRRKWDETIRRITRGDVRFPVDLEEAWVAALGEPWRTQCKRELAWRHGLWGAVRHEQGSAGDHKAWASALHQFGELTQSVGDVLADGAIDSEDLEQLPDLINTARAMQADLASLEQRALTVLRQNGHAVPEGTTDQSA